MAGMADGKPAFQSVGDECSTESGEARQVEFGIGEGQDQGGGDHAEAEVAA